MSDDFKMQDVQHSQSDDFWEFCRDIWIEFRRIWSCRKLPLFSWPYLFRRRIIWVGVEGCRTSTNVGLLDLKKIWKWSITEWKIFYKIKKIDQNGSQMDQNVSFWTKQVKLKKIDLRNLVCKSGHLNLRRQTDMHSMHSILLIPIEFKWF